LGQSLLNATSMLLLHAPDLLCFFLMLTSLNLSKQVTSDALLPFILEPKPSSPDRNCGFLVNEHPLFLQSCDLAGDIKSLIC